MDAILIRDYLKEYVNSEDESVTWQRIILKEYQTNTETNLYPIFFIVPFGSSRDLINVFIAFTKFVEAPQERFLCIFLPACLCWD